MAITTIPVPTTNFLLWKICAWAGPVYCLAILLAWAWIGRFFPPPREHWDVAEVYRFVTDNNLRIRTGMVLVLIVSPLYYVWSSVVSRIMQRTEGPDGVLSNIELLGGFGTTLVTFGSVTCWLSASFDTALKTPQDIKALNDLGWMWFNGTAMVTVTQFVAFGTAFLVDKRPTPLLPQWMSWFSYAMAGTLLLALLTPFFHNGPFAWHGLFTYYIGLGGFFLWILVACYYVIRAIDRLERESLAG